MRYLASLLLVLALPAHADDGAEYCQQLVNTLSVQRTQAEDSLAVVTARLNLANKQIEELRKQLQEAVKKGQ